MATVSRRALLLTGAAGTAAALLPGQPGQARAGTGTGQPWASNWFPADVLGWSPGGDPDAPFNRSTTPLARRITDRHTTANPEARPRRIMGLSVFAPTDGNPAQGSAQFDYYTSEFWQYIDRVIFWGGSASEGLILAPNPTVTDAAHRNGVPVYGTVFFPPNVYGGNIDWVRQLVVRDALGRFPVAAKLAEIAAHHGFEGWFINQETDGADAALAEQMRLFAVELKKKTQVIWYDAMNVTGAVGWRGRLDALNAPYFATSDTMFVDFRWDFPDLPSSAEYARGMRRDPSDLFAAVDTGWRQFKVQLDFDAVWGDCGLSVGLYRPDFTLTSIDDKTQYEARESRFWVGADGDPSTSTADHEGWRGVSAKVAESTVVTGLPFSSTFNTGHGRLWADRGRVWQRGDWNNLTAQDILPTWRWLVGGSPLTVAYDYTTAWHGGSSLRISGQLGERATLPLYATRLRVQPGTRLAVTVQGSARLAGLVRFLDAPDVDVEVPLRPVRNPAGFTFDPEPGDVIAEEPEEDEDSGWRTWAADLSRHTGRTLVRAGIAIRPAGAPGDVTLRLGRFALDLPGTGTGTRRRVPVTKVERFGAAARVQWRGGAGRYEIQAVEMSGNRTWLGCTTANAFYAWAVPSGARIEVWRMSQ